MAHVDPHMIKVRVVCRRCGDAGNVCVPIRRGVPDELRCDHVEGHGGMPRDAGGGLICGKCGCHWRVPEAGLAPLIEDALGRDLNRWRREGAVTVEIDC